MKIELARAYANVLLAAAEQAESEGRDALTKADLNLFQQLDDASRAELAAVIALAE